MSTTCNRRASSFPTCVDGKFASVQLCPPVLRHGGASSTLNSLPPTTVARFEMDRDRKDKELNEKYETLRVVPAQHLNPHPSARNPQP